MRKRDTVHDANKRYVRDFPDGDILRRAIELAAVDESEREALRLYALKRVPITVIAERLGYEKTYFSHEKFKRILVKYVYCLCRLQKERVSGRLTLFWVRLRHVNAPR